ncbi:MAG: amidophosphoribosyltransferase [Dehalococcoidales bacterium]|nr:amidophosphoribosyltransferase [Dehalococcoidales bacterium]
MGAFFGIVSKRDVISDVFFGTDYHSHLGTKRGGMAAYDKEIGLQREIHNIENSPFRTKFVNIHKDMKGTSAIGCISDFDPQPLLIRSKLGVYAIAIVGRILNQDALIDKLLSDYSGHFDAMTSGAVNSTEIVAALINSKKTYTEGVEFAQSVIEGTASIILLKDDGNIIVARDRLGRLPVVIGKNDEGFAVTFESFAFEKLGYADHSELGPGEIVEITPTEIKQLKEPGKEMRICSFLWSYYGYPTSNYEGVNVEVMRYRNGHIMAKRDKATNPDMKVDYVCGVPDSGIPHAIGYSNESGIPFARAFIKYTPTWSRSFMPTDQTQRNKVAKMKLIAVPELIKDKDLLFVDDSVVRGTQLRETVEFLLESGAKSVNMRSACPPIMFGCKFLNFSRATSDMELIARRIMFELEGEDSLNYVDEYSNPDTERGKKLRQIICDELHLTSIEFQTIEGVIAAIGLDPSKLCTYCWTGKE